ncbi:MAG: hypothetical protein QXU93_11660 [Thermoproteus sp.]
MSYTEKYTEKYVVSPNGWLALPPGTKIALTPPYELNRFRSMDVGPHHKAISLSITTINVLPFDDGQVEEFFRIDTRAKIYYVRLVKAKGAVGTLGNFAHELQVMCVPEPCDASVLFALNDPLTSAEYAARTFKTLARVPKGDTPRWIWDVIQISYMRPEEMPSHYVTVWDTLTNPETLRLLWRLTFDQTKEVREKAHAAGLWSNKPPEAGAFTTSAVLALRPLLHLVPRIPCESFPKGVSVAVCK